MDLSKAFLNHDRKVKDAWAHYWKNYHGVTKIGAWSQKKSLEKAFSIILEEGIKHGVRVIDVGCGEGRTLRAFREKGFKNSIGIDNVKESLKICQQNGLKVGKDVFLDEATRTKFKDGQFDLVFSEGLLEHFIDPTLLIAEMARISKRYILLIQPNHQSLYGKLIAIVGNKLRNNVKEYSFSKDYFRKKFEGLGSLLKVQKYTLFGEFFILLFEKK